MVRHSYRGVYPYQMARGFLGIALAVFVCYMFGKGLVKQRGWLHIAVGASVMVLWDFLGLLYPSVDSSIVLGMGGSFFGTKAAFENVNFWLYMLNGILLAASLFFLYQGIRWHYRSMEGKK